MTPLPLIFLILTPEYAVNNNYGFSSAAQLPVYYDRGAFVPQSTVFIGRPNQQYLPYGQLHSVYAQPPATSVFPATPVSPTPSKPFPKEFWRASNDKPLRQTPPRLHSDVTYASQIARNSRPDPNNPVQNGFAYSAINSKTTERATTTTEAPTEAPESTEGTTPVKNITSTAVIGYSFEFSSCSEGFLQDENGICQKQFTKKQKERLLDRKKRSVDLRNTDQPDIPPDFFNEETTTVEANTETTSKKIDSWTTSTARPPYLYLISATCEKGYVLDFNNVCTKVVNVKKKDKINEANQFRRKRENNQQMSFKGYEGRRNGQKQVRDSVTNNLKHELNASETHRNETNPILEKTPTDEKNAASDGFGYITKECSKLVPGLVSDGAGGCTKFVKTKEKILQLERRKREARNVYVSQLSPGDNKTNFTIRIIVKGFNQRPIENNEDVTVSNTDDKAVANNGFGISSSRCNSLVPGLVSDGAGGCTRVVKGNRKTNKFAFILRSSQKPEPFTDLEYDAPEPQLQSASRIVFNDPDADII